LWNDEEGADVVENLLPLERMDLNHRIFEAAIEIKATNSLSVCDSWVAATAVATQSILVHKDPEFEKLKTIEAQASSLQDLEQSLRPQGFITQIEVDLARYRDARNGMELIAQGIATDHKTDTVRRTRREGLAS
jgi:hypothetical protein